MTFHGPCENNPDSVPKLGEFFALFMCSTVISFILMTELLFHFNQQVKGILRYSIIMMVMALCVNTTLTGLSSEGVIDVALW